VSPGSRGRYPAPRGAHDQALPNQEGLGDGLHGVGLLPHGDGEVADPDRPSTEPTAQRVEHGAVEAV
jgi:hypothetical protein